MIVTGAMLHHTCFVVKDADRTAQRLAETMGIRPWSVWTIEPDDCTVHGKDQKFAFRAAIAQVGGSAYELISPAGGKSVIDEHLATKGEGFHHTALFFPTHQALLSAMAEMISNGRTMIQSGRIADLGEFCYFDVPETGSVIEFLYLSELPPPETTIG